MIVKIYFVYKTYKRPILGIAVEHIFFAFFRENSKVHFFSRIQWNAQFFEILCYNQAVK